MSIKTLYYKRGFLNKEKGTAVFEAEIESCFEGIWVNATFCLTDCSRKVSLDFSTHETAPLQESLNKVNLLIRELEQFRDALAKHELE